MLCNLRQYLRIVANALFAQTSPQTVLDNPVDLQIRIPADRRSKMAVTIRCQTKMPGIFHRIACLLHRAKGQTADQRFLRSSVDFSSSFCSSFGCTSSLPMWREYPKLLINVDSFCIFPNLAAHAYDRQTEVLSSNIQLPPSRLQQA